MYITIYTGHPVYTIWLVRKPNPVNVGSVTIEGGEKSGQISKHVTVREINYEGTTLMCFR